MTYSFATADGDRPTQTALANFRTDSQRAAKQRKAFRLRAIRASSRYSLNSLLSRLVLPNSTVSLLLIGATSVTLLVSHAAYA